MEMERRRMKGRGERKEEELIQGSQVRQRIDARGDSASTCRHEGQIPTKEKEIDNDKRKKKKKKKRSDIETKGSGPGGGEDGNHSTTQ